MSQLTDKVESAIMQNIKDKGLELEYTEYVKEGENNIYRIVVDKPSENVTINDCEELSRAVEDIVDKYINAKNGYVLEVSSAGLERELKNIRLYNKYIGYEVKVKLFKKVNDKKEIQGELIKVDNNSIVLKGNTQDIEIELKNIAHANTVYDFES